MEKYNEEVFYNNNGWPPEEYFYCKYALPIMDEMQTEEDDYDQFALVVNADFPYIRLTKKRGKNHIPCGMAASPATDGFFASKSEIERDDLCPKIALGFVAVFLSTLRYDPKQKDYVLLKPLRELMERYYREYFGVYMQCHDGLKYSSISDEEKELMFIEGHRVVTRQLWGKSTPLKDYTVLYKYASVAEKNYEDFFRGTKTGNTKHNGK